MKILVLVGVLLVAINTLSVISFNEDEFEQELFSGKHIWLVHRAGIVDDM